MDDLVLAVEALRRRSSSSAAKVAPEVLAGYLATSKQSRRGGNKRVRPLTFRQTEVLQLLAEGNSSRQVGTALKISSSTVETHRANIMRRIDCQSTAELVRYAIQNHIAQA
jgi:DNA-binding NarL/FixJ family response regulator